MYQHAIQQIKNSIFPIFYQSVQGANTQLGVSGTGFFIDNFGHFITAHHVMSEVPPQSTFLYFGNVPERVIPAIPILEIYSDPSRDIFLGKVETGALPPVKLSFDKPNIGKSVCLCGYPLAQITKNPNGSLHMGNVRQYWQPTFVIDKITANIGNRYYSGFMTQDISLNGMSGGPVFDLDGTVYGVDVAFLTREIPQKDRAPIAVHNGVVVENNTLIDVYQKVNLGGYY